MNRSEDLSSTDRLLNMIRQKPGPDEVPPASPPVRKRGPALPRFLRKKEKASVGVDFDHAYLRLILLRRLPDGRQEIAGFRTAPLGYQIAPYSPAFTALLRSELGRICRGSADPEIWSILPAQKIRFHHFSLPKDSAKQLEQTLYWRFKGETDFDEENDLLDYQVIGEGTTTPGQIDVLAFSTPRRRIDRAKRLFESAGYPLAGLTTVPFTLGNFYRQHWIEGGEGRGITVFIGRRWTVISIHLSSGAVLFTRTVRASLEGMIGAVKEHLQRYPEDRFSPAERGSGDDDHAENILSHWIRQSTAFAEGAAEEAPPERVVEILLPTWDRLCSQVSRTLHRFPANPSGGPADRIHLFGEIALSLRFRRYVEERLDLKATAPDLFGTALFHRTLDRETFPPPERAASAPVLGLGLSHETDTPNLLFPSKEKKVMRKSAFISRLMVKALVAVLAICIGIAFWQSQRLGEKYETVEKLRNRLAASGPRWTREMFGREIEKIRGQKAEIGLYSRIYRPLVLLLELEKLTPEQIRLTGLQAGFGAVNGKGNYVQAGTLALDGIIRGRELQFDLDLIGYRERIEASPLFALATVEKKERITDGKTPRMYFTLRMETR